MARSRVTVTLLVALMAAPLALLAVACSRPPEQQLLTQFFRAARARDNTTLAMMSAVEFDPREQGTVEDFEIVDSPPAESTPVDLAGLVEAVNKAEADERAFSQQKVAYQNENLEIIEEVIKLERTENPRYSPAQQKVKDEWDKWRSDTSEHAKTVSDARVKLQEAQGPAAASLTQPGRPPFDPGQYVGNIETKKVTLNAQVRSPEGQVAPKTLVVTFQRAVGTLGGEEREGRWIITGIDEA
ncbi:MAG: hypothetical protein AB7O67_12880 [Vicinamibacterales bacterium]